jgi:predicted negative regulator of RcsB-dependent stress response
MNEITAFFQEEPQEVESKARKRTPGVATFGYIGFIVFGLYTSFETILKLPESNLHKVSVWLTFGLVYIILSYNLLKLKNWARISLFIINTLMAILITLLDILIFIWIPWATVANPSPGVFVKIFKTALSSCTISNLMIFFIIHFYFYGFLVLFTRAKVKEQFGNVGPQEPSTPGQTSGKIKLWLVILILFLVVAISSGAFVFAGPLDLGTNDIKINIDPEQDPLSCAIAVAQKIKLDNHDKSRLLKRIAAAYAEIGKYDQALKITNVLKKPYGRAKSLTEIASCCLKAGEKDKACNFLSQALQVSKTIKDDFIKSESLERTAVKYAEAGQFDQALQIANTINRACYKASALAEIASNYAKVSQMDKASEILFQAFEAAKQEDNSAIANDNLTEIAVKYAEIGQYGQALQVANTIGSTRLKAEALGGIAANMKPEQTEKSADILSKSLQEAKKIEDAKLQAVTSGRIAIKFAQTGQYDQALQIANTIKKPVYKAGILTKVASNYAQAGQKDKAADILYQASEAAVEADSDLSIFLSGTMIASNYIKIGQKDRACFILSKVLPLADAMSNEDLKNAMLANTVAKYAQAGQYNQALQIAKEITIPASKADAFVSIIINYAQDGQKEGDEQSSILNEITKELKWYKNLFTFNRLVEKVTILKQTGS